MKAAGREPFSAQTRSYKLCRQSAPSHFLPRHSFFRSNAAFPTAQVQQPFTTLSSSQGWALVTGTVIMYVLFRQPFAIPSGQSYIHIHISNTKCIQQVACVCFCVTMISIKEEVMNPRGNGARKGGGGGQRKGVQEMMSLHCIHVRNVNEKKHFSILFRTPVCSLLCSLMMV